MIGFTCAVCGREWATRNARAQHERRSHPEWKAAPDLAAARRTEVLRSHLDAHPTARAERNRRFRERHPEREAASQAKYRTANRQAVRDRTRAWRASPGAQEKKRAVRQQQIAEGKHSARMAVFRAVRSGALQRGPCAACRAIEVEAHHHLGYEREHWLDVIWLCDVHHSDAHHAEAAALRQQIA